MRTHWKIHFKVGLAVVLSLCVAATVVKKISDYPAVTTPASGDLFLLASGATNKNVSYSNLKTSINATNVNGSGTANTLTKWTGTNTLGSIANGVGTLTNDGAGNFGFTTSIVQEVTYNSLSVTTLTAITHNVINQNFQVGKGGHLTITNEVRFPWATLTLSGTTVSTISLTNSSMFKLTLTTNAFFGSPTDLPTTNAAQTFQIFVKQDGTGGRTVTFTNSYWIVAGSGTSSNAVPSITTNADAVSILTFTTSPFADKAYGVVTATGP